MTTVAAYLRSAAERGLAERLGDEAELLLTPRWPTSRHVIALIVTPGSTTPSLVAKMPRLSGGGAGLEREAANLRALHNCSPTEFPAAPRLVAFEQFAGTPILVQTALAGRTITPAMLRRRNATSVVQAAVEWATALPRTQVMHPDTWAQELIDKPLEQFGSVLADAGEALTRATRTLLEPLRRTPIPLVFEHGDLSHPNLILLGDGRLGVIDWELARPQGLPGHDLTFFLAYVASARKRPASREDEVAAFDDAFVGPRAWGRPILERYAAELGVERTLLAPLVLACWARYTVQLLARIAGERRGGAEAERALAEYPYHDYWRYAVERFDDLA